ncbi:MAG: hypothetical protein HZB10_01945 [Candidatus Yonathbacteria bacterium]|nr:hypothetical protein [Candidatus Yonathbacteria bacterium]
MIPFQERKKLRKILYSKVTILVLFLVLLAVGRGAWGVYQKAEIARGERDVALRTLTDIESRTAKLETSLNRLKSEQGIEEEVRQKYMVSKLGEEVVVVVDDSAKKGENTETGTDRGFWSRFVEFF